MGQIKTSHWQCLPWLLAGLALADEEASRAIGRRCIALYEDQSDLSPATVYGRLHPLSKRFLGPNFGDDALRSSLDEFLNGACRKDLDDFCSWCGALRLMKTTEQPTEGLRRSLNQLMTRAPNASPAYLSTESRLPMFQKAFGDPQALAQLATNNADLASQKDLIKAVAHLVGGQLCEPATDKSTSHAQLVRLLYHCHFKYDRGKETALALPLSTEQTLRRNKQLGMT